MSEPRKEKRPGSAEEARIRIATLLGELNVTYGKAIALKLKNGDEIVGTYFPVGVNDESAQDLKKAGFYLGAVSKAAYRMPKKFIRFLDVEDISIHEVPVDSAVADDTDEKLAA